MDDYLVGVRLRETGAADDYRGVRPRASRRRPRARGDLRRDHHRRGTPAQARDSRGEEGPPLPARSAPCDRGGGAGVPRAPGPRGRAIETAQQVARGRGLSLKVVDVEMHPVARRATVYFSADERIDFRDLVRDLARELRARVEMRQIGARDTTKLMDGIGPCGRQLCCSSHLRRFEPISVKMAKAQDMPLTDNRLLGNCGRLKCCLLYEFSTYEELRARLPRVNTPCQASCGGGGCMSGKVRSIRVLKQTRRRRLPRRHRSGSAARPGHLGGTRAHPAAA